jgi:hypothetical protein
LRDDLASELGGRDLFVAQQALKGAPCSVDEAVARMREQVEFERGGAVNAVGNAVVDLMNDSGKRLEKNARRVEQTWDDAQRDGQLDPTERARLSELLGYVADDAAQLGEVRDKIASTASDLVTTTAAVAVVAATGGAAAPLALSTLATAAGAGAVAKVGTSALLRGRSYDVDDLPGEVAAGAVKGAAAVAASGLASKAATAQLTARAKKEIARAATEHARQLAAARGQQLTQASLQGVAAKATTRSAVELFKHDALLRATLLDRAQLAAVAGAVDGAASGGAGALVSAAVSDGAWDDGAAKGLQRMAVQGTAGAVSGAVVGAGVGALTGALGKLPEVAIDRDALRYQAPDGADSVMLARPTEMLLVDRALEPNPPTVQVGTGATRQSVKVYGTRSAAEVAQVQQAFDRWSAVAGGKQPAQIVDQVHLRDMIARGADGKEATLGFHLSFNRDETGSVMLSRHELFSGDNLQQRLFHEGGHAFEVRRGMIQDGVATPFGKGPTVSEYARLNASEDLAETHRYLLQHWDDIQADPERYLHGNGAVGQKVKALVKEYGLDLPLSRAQSAQRSVKDEVGRALGKNLDDPRTWDDSVRDLVSNKFLELNGANAALQSPPAVALAHLPDATSAEQRGLYAYFVDRLNNIEQLPAPRQQAKQVLSDLKMLQLPAELVEPLKARAAFFAADTGSVARLQARAGLALLGDPDVKLSEVASQLQTSLRDKAAWGGQHGFGTDALAEIRRRALRSDPQFLERQVQDALNGAASFERAELLDALATQLRTLPLSAQDRAGYQVAAAMLGETTLGLGSQSPSLLGTGTGQGLLGGALPALGAGRK